MLRTIKLLELYLNSCSKMSAKNCDQYRDKIILGPMVRIGTLAFRLLSMRYGADLVYSEEIIDWRFLRAKRMVNDALGTIDYIDATDGTTVFTTSKEEKPKVILQLGTSDAARALKVGLLVQDDIAGLDINMGCPKDFSLKGGMGAALLKQPEKVKDILTTLVSNLKIPVTCKIRVLGTVEETIEFAKMIQSTGVSALAIHGRMVHERPRHSNRNSHIKEVASHLDIPVIANGGSMEIKTYEDIAKFKEETGCDSVMVCRAAEWNASIFRPEGKLDLDTVIKAYVTLAVDTNTPFTNVKYTIQNMLREQQETPFGKLFLATQTIDAICDLWDLKEYYLSSKAYKFTDLYRTWGTKHKAYDTSENGNSNGVNDENAPSSKKAKVEEEGGGTSKEDDGSMVLIPGCIFIRGHYATNEDLPKSILLTWARKNKLVGPTYKTEYVDKRFRSVVTVGGRQFTTDLWEKNKKQAEQAAAMACVKFMKIGE